MKLGKDVNLTLKKLTEANTKGKTRENVRKKD